jgi:hypothetical protein
MTNHLGYMARASSPEAAPPGERPCTGASLAVTGSAAGAGRTRLGRSSPRIADAPTAPDAADRMRRAFRSPLPPRQEMATAPPGGEIRGRPSARQMQPRGRRAFPRASPFPPVGRLPIGDTPGRSVLAWTGPCPKGRAGAPRHSAGPAARQVSWLSMPGAQPPPAQRASPDAAPAAWLPPSAQVRARRRMKQRDWRDRIGSRRAPTPTLRHSRAGGNPASRKYARSAHSPWVPACAGMTKKRNGARRDAEARRGSADGKVALSQRRSN